MTEWFVGAIVNEPEPVVVRFVEWYRRLGATKITILFDNPDDPVQSKLAAMDTVHCVPCTDAFWREVGLKPEVSFPKRQNAAMSWLYRRFRTGWLLNVDADEFLWPGPMGVAGLLARAAPAQSAIRIETAEHIVPTEAQEDVLFRLPMGSETRRHVYGGDAPLFGPKRMGFVGHRFGKSLTRCGIPGTVLRQHWPQTEQGTPLPTLEMKAKDGAYLLHMPADDFEIWREKLDWRMNSAGFTVPLKQRIAEILERPDPEGSLRDLYWRLHCAAPDLVERMSDASVLLRLPRASCP